MSCKFGVLSAFLPMKCVFCWPPSRRKPRLLSTRSWNKSRNVILLSRFPCGRQDLNKIIKISQSFLIYSNIYSCTTNIPRDSSLFTMHLCPSFLDDCRTVVLHDTLRIFFPFFFYSRSVLTWPQTSPPSWIVTLFHKYTRLFLCDYLHELL